MSYRKGFPRIPITLDTWSERHPVAKSIASGSYWFDAWVSQRTTYYSRLSHLTGIPANRFIAISQGDRVSRAEVDALARAWSISANDLIASMPSPDLVVD